MKPCTKINNCHKIISLRDHDFADDYQLARAIEETCKNCPEYTTKKIISPETYMVAWNKLHQVLDERQEQEMLDLMDSVLGCINVNGGVEPKEE